MMRRAICSNQSPICVITDAAAAAAVCFLSGKLDGKAEEETLLLRRRGRGGGGCNVICEETGLFLDGPFCPRLFFFLFIFILLPARNKYQKQSRAQEEEEDIEKDYSTRPPVPVEIMK